MLEKILVSTAEQVPALALFVTTVILLVRFFLAHITEQAKRTEQVLTNLGVLIQENTAETQRNTVTLAKLPSEIAASCKANAIIHFDHNKEGDKL